MVVERDLEEPTGKRWVRDQGWVAGAPLNRRGVRRVTLRGAWSDRPSSTFQMTGEIGLTTAAELPNANRTSGRAESWAREKKKRLEKVRKERNIVVDAVVVWLDRSEARRTFILLHT